MESAIFSALLAIPALSNAAFRPQNNNVEVCYCAEPSAAPGKRGRSLFSRRETEAQSKRPVWEQGTSLPSAPQSRRAQGGSGGALPRWYPWQGWREGCCDTHPALASPLQGLRSPPRSSFHSPAPGIIHLDATRCQWPGTNDTPVMGFRKGEGLRGGTWGERQTFQQEK